MDLEGGIYGRSLAARSTATPGTRSSLKCFAGPYPDTYGARNDIHRPPLLVRHHDATHCGRAAHDHPCDRRCGPDDPACGQRGSATKPTVVLVHGAFAESSSWDGVVKRLMQRGYPVAAVANPLRGVRSDADYVANILASIPGPVVLVGHSYGGNVITNAATKSTQVKALVFVAAFAPDAGETASAMTSRYPGSTLGPALAPPVLLAGGGKDLYVERAKYHSQFAADLPLSQAQLLAVAQRPVTESALDEPSGPPAWKTIPSWFIYGSDDKNIPPQMRAANAQRWLAVSAAHLSSSLAWRSNSFARAACPPSASWLAACASLSLS
jgi:pimeloyl-ACP methyl ester carboxylesterase